MSALPRFSVVICNYNYAQFVADAIRSALDQDYPAELVEVIVVDDGSTDGSRDTYAAFANDPRFVAILQDNHGQTAAFATGAQKATGDYICLLDSDDIFLPAKLARVASCIADSDVPRDTLFLCHDLYIDAIGDETPERLSNTWLHVAGVAKHESSFRLNQPARAFPFSNPSGLVFSRALLLDCLLAIPQWDFMRGTDGVLCQATLLRTGRVDYLHEPLSSYRIHADNEVARIVNGRYVHRFSLDGRLPKILAYLERWVDSLAQSTMERGQTLDYLMRLERLVRRPSASRRLVAPKVGVVLLGEIESRPVAATHSAQLQSHLNTDLIVAPSAQSSELLQMAQAWMQNDCEYIVFIRDGDQLDRTFVERHLFFRQHTALVTASCSDIRLVSAGGALVHADVFNNSGAWKQPIQQVPPLATSLRDWVAPPMSSCMFRRNVLLDRLFFHAPSAPPALQAAGFWLLMQFAHHTGGVLRLRETLSSCRLRDGAAASYGYLSAASGADGTLTVVPLAEAVDWFGLFYAQEQDLLRQWLPDAWHRRFGDWLGAQRKSVGEARRTPV